MDNKNVSCILINNIAIQPLSGKFEKCSDGFYMLSPLSVFQPSHTKAKVFVIFLKNTLKRFVTQLLSCTCDLPRFQGKWNRYCVAKGDRYIGFIGYIGLRCISE